MLRKQKALFGAALGAAVLALAASAWADIYKPVSNKHTNYGVSQFSHTDLAGQTCTGTGCNVFQLLNPGKVTQAVATLVYSRGLLSGEIRGAEEEVFLGCRVDVVTSHGAVAVQGADVPVGTFDDRRYAEFIWTPVDEVEIKRKDGTTVLGRFANGLGGGVVMVGGGESPQHARLSDPRMFSFPEEGTEEAADCICLELNLQGLPTDIFNVFGMHCGSV